MEGVGFDVFLSYNRSDEAAVTHIAERLREQGIQPWLDRWALTPGGGWREEIVQGLHASRACAVILGPHGLSNWAREELDVAHDRAVDNRGFRMFLVLLPGASNPNDPSLAFLRNRTWVDLRAGIDNPHGLQSLMRAITSAAVPQLQDPLRATAQSHTRSISNKPTAAGLAIGVIAVILAALFFARVELLMLIPFVLFGFGFERAWQAIPKTYRRRPGLVFAAIGVILLAAVLTVLLFRWVGSRFPTPVESSLLDQVPASFRDTCSRAGFREFFARAAVRCVPFSGAETAVYTLFVTAEDRDRAYSIVVAQAGVDPNRGNCANDAVAEHPYVTKDGRTGRILCYRAASESFLFWTEDGSATLTSASRPSLDLPQLYRWWSDLETVELTGTADPAE